MKQRINIACIGSELMVSIVAKIISDVNINKTVLIGANAVATKDISENTVL